MYMLSVWIYLDLKTKQQFQTPLDVEAKKKPKELYLLFLVVLVVPEVLWVPEEPVLMCQEDQRCQENQGHQGNQPLL